MGYGFAWLPESHIQKELSDGLLKPIPLKEGGIREIPLYLMIANPEIAGSGVKRLVEIIKEATIQSQDRKNF
jgi:DNA-binding transcriptional LysR family regulator